MLAFGARVGVFIGVPGQMDQGRMAVRTVQGFEQAVGLLVQLIIDQHVALFALIQLITDVALMDAIALQQIDLLKAAGTFGLIDGAHDRFRFRELNNRVVPVGYYYARWRGASSILRPIIVMA